MLAYGGNGSTSAFALAFATGTLLSAISVATALGMGRQHIVLTPRSATA